MSSVVARKVLSWKMRLGYLVAFSLGMVLGIVLLLQPFRLPSIPFLSQDMRRENNATVTALTRESQVALASAGVQGLVSEENKTRVLGMPVLFTERVKFVQYSYKAKLGVDGKKVVVSKVGDKKYKVVVPDFMFIGHDDVHFRVAVEKDGVLGWVTPEIDTAPLVESILNDETKNQLLRDNREMLAEQTLAFYRNILAAVEPGASVEVELPQG